MATTEFHILGISLAVLSAAALSIGNIWQSRGVQLATENKGNKKLFVTMLKTRVWLMGAAMYGLAMLLQIASLTFAPLMLVQPIGILALVFAVFLGARLSGTSPSREIYRAMTTCLIGVAGYVIIAAQVSKQKPIDDAELIAILSALFIALLAVGVVRVINHGQARRAPIIYVVLGGVFNAFVASLGKTVILRIQALLKADSFVFNSGTVLTLACLLGVGLASFLAIYYIQTAYTCNPSDIVVAGTTVIDPAVSVLIGITILHEATNASPLSLLLIAICGLIAILGVINLSKAETTPATAESSGDKSTKS
ncbi:DMT family transporter [Microbacterium sp. H1-D42]|uniref:DMT family transporter n=1 Tax=Microbacterium sp. H1-D42 TaxID=2925844 RepID=UPI001F53AA30|nr:DMT family transporter [Microbacterium sp. H1-D42]UNK71319.1 DMT family transporter [Microbacterium sp. H1-D42]